MEQASGVHEKGDLRAGPRTLLALKHGEGAGNGRGVKASKSQTIVTAGEGDDGEHRR